MRAFGQMCMQRVVVAVAVAIVVSLTAAGATGTTTAFGAGAAASLADCSSGARTLSTFGARVYPDQGNGGYKSVHTDLHIAYDTTANLFLPGTHADLTIRATQCLTDFSFDFERTAMSGSAAGPNLTVSAVTIDGQPASFAFKQPTYPGNPNGPDDPDPAAHAISNVESRQRDQPEPAGVLAAGGQHIQNGMQCPANKLVITPASPVADGQTITVRIDYTGRPGVHTDGDGSTEGWFRVNTAAAPNDGIVRHHRAGREHGLDAAQQPPDREADLRHLRHRSGRQDRDRPRRARRRGAGRALRPRRTDAGQPARRELPRRLVAVALARARRRSRATSSRTRSAPTTWSRGRA